MKLILLFAGLVNTVAPLFIIHSVHISITISFYLIAISLTVLLALALRADRARPAIATVYIFCQLFFFIAPIVQLYFDPVTLVNTLPVDHWEVSFANLIIAFFVLIVVISYASATEKISEALSIKDEEIASLMPALVVLSICVAIWAALKLAAIDQLIQSLNNEDNTLVNLIETKVFFTIPFLTAALFIIKPKTRGFFLCSLLLLALVVATKNPVFDRRNALGPVYVSLFLLAFPSFASTQRRLLFTLMATLIFAFPAVSIFTHYYNELSSDITVQSFADQILGHFNDLHYDAWSNIVAAINYVGERGFQWGRQLVGVMFFFVPRVLWSDKPVASGQILGDYLTDEGELWFNNISCPVPAEGYLDFGLLGVALYSIGVGRFARYLDICWNSANNLNMIFAIYFSLHLVFLLRGSFLPAFAYGVGAYVAIRLVPLLVKIIFRFFGYLKASSVGRHARASK